MPTSDRPDRVRSASRSRRVAIGLGALAGVLAGGVVSASVAAARVSPAASEPVSAMADAPPQVAVISRMLDAFATGSAAGPGVIQGLVSTVAGSQALPPPGDQLQAAVTQGFAEVAAQMKSQGQAGVEAMREVVAPMACLNPQVNEGIEVLALALDSVAGAGEVIAPLDVTAAELSVLLRSFQTPPSTSC